MRQLFFHKDAAIRLNEEMTNRIIIVNNMLTRRMKKAIESGSRIDVVSQNLRLSSLIKVELLIYLAPRSAIP